MLDRMRWTIGLLAALALLLSAPSAQADRLTRLARLGDRVFGPAPCGAVTTYWATRAERRAAGASDEAVAWVSPEQPCTINLLRTHVPGPVLCHRWLHERGHVAGLAHSDNPHSIMWPYENTDALVVRGRVRYKYVDRRCRSLAERLPVRPVRPLESLPVSGV